MGTTEEIRNLLPTTISSIRHAVTFPAVYILRDNSGLIQTTTTSALSWISAVLVCVPPCATDTSSSPFSLLSRFSRYRIKKQVKISTTPKQAQAMKPGRNSGASEVLHTASENQI